MFNSSRPLLQVAILGFCATKAFAFTTPLHVSTHPATLPTDLQRQPSKSPYLLPTAATRTIRATFTQLELGVEPHQLWIAQQATEVGGNLLQAYGNLLRQHPIATKGVTAAILAAAGDGIAQWRSDSKDYDAVRGAGFLVFGALYTGIFQHFWFQFMNSHITDWGDVIGIWGPERVSFPIEDVVNQWSQWWKYFDVVTMLERPPSPEALAAAKVVFNQMVVIPLIYMPLFLAFTGLISGLDKNQALARAQSLYLPLLQRNWFFWLPMQFLQFLVIPVDYQIPFLSAASLVWTVILSSIGAGSTPPASPSQIVAYETAQLGADGSTSIGVDGEEIVTVLQVEPGDANAITDNVRLEDVIPTSLMVNATTAAVDPLTKWTTSGLTAGLLASAADEGGLGTVVGDLVNQDPGVGVAVVTIAAGLGGYLAAAASAGQSNNSTTTDTIIDTTIATDQEVVMEDSPLGFESSNTVFDDRFKSLPNATQGMA